MLYEELLASCRCRFDEFFSNVTLFENQFRWSDFNQQCYDAMYINNTYDNVASVKKLKESIPCLSDMCKRCAEFFIPARNKSIPKYDVILGKQHEEALMGYLSVKLNAKTERADLSDRGLPDCKILKPNGNVAAYFEVKFHGAPFVMASRFTGRYCYEGSATLDCKKVEKQLKLIDELDAPVFYVHWIEYPCLKGIFYETSEQVKNLFASEQEDFSRSMREGDNEKSIGSVYLKKKYSLLLNMGSFESFLDELKTLVES